ncbi:MAG: hypothetical protein WCP55_19230, partial [Lentisphaerota bacterium]
GYPYGPGDEKPKYAYYGMQELTGETLKDLTPVKDFGFVPGLSQVVWEASIPIDKPLKYKFFRPDGKIEEGDLAELAKKGGRAVGDLPDGSAIVIATTEGFTVRVKGQSLGYAFQVVAAKDPNKQDCLQANLRIAPRTADATVKAGTKYQWSFETVAQAMENPLKPDISWLKVLKGKLLENFVGATVEADGGVVKFAIAAQPLKVNSTPFTVKGVNSNWTCGYFEPKSGLFRQLGSENGVVYAQIDASQKNLEFVIGNVVTCEQPELRIFATQVTDAEGKATGKWRLDLLNPSDKAVTATLKPGVGFEALLSAKPQTVSVPAGAAMVVTW